MYNYGEEPKLRHRLGAFAIIILVICAIDAIKPKPKVLSKEDDKIWMAMIDESLARIDRSNKLMDSRNLSYEEMSRLNAWMMESLNAANKFHDEHAK